MVGSKPIVCVTSFNRLEELKETVRGIYETTEGCTDLEGLYIVDNGSTDGSQDWLNDNWQADRGNFGCIYHKRNIGCPRALNEVLHWRRPGQAFVKMDNDVRALTKGWVGVMQRIAIATNAAMIGPWYEGVFGKGNVRLKETLNDSLHRVDLLPGHFVWHTGRFMDRAGHFDLVHEDHLYGFEDWIMCHKAHLLHMPILVTEAAKMKDLQTRKGYADIGAEGKQEHVERMRPYFEERLYKLRHGESFMYTPPSGVPAAKTESVL